MSKDLVFKKSVGKSTEYRLGPAERSAIYEVKQNLRNMCKNYDDYELDDEMLHVIYNILSLDDYDLNLLLGYYVLGNGSATSLSNYVGAGQNVISVRIKKILKNLRVLCI